MCQAPFTSVKPGSCPNVNGSIGICLEGCKDDSTCSGVQKCVKFKILIIFSHKSWNFSFKFLISSVRMGADVHAKIQYKCNSLID